MESRLAVSREKLSEVEQHLTKFYAASSSSTERHKIAEALSFVRAALESVTEPSIAIEALPEDQLQVE